MTKTTFHIRLITPNADPTIDIADEIAVHVERYAPLIPGLVISHRLIDDGPASIKTDEDARRAAPFVVKKVLEAAREGVDAVIIDCFSQPGLTEARHLVRIPVVGPGEAAMKAAVQRAPAPSLIALVYTVEEARTALSKGAAVIVIATTGKVNLAEDIRDQLGAEAIDPLSRAFQDIADEQRLTRNV